jgi:hypothetical protein
MRVFREQRQLNGLAQPIKLEDWTASCFRRIFDLKVSRIRTSRTVRGGYSSPAKEYGTLGRHGRDGAVLR